MNTSKTKLLVLSVASFLWVISSQTVNAQSPRFLYRAKVIGDNAIVHCGPGTTHYGTDRLKPGTEVDVYRKDPGGWLLIRPPEGSFSLVQRDQIELLEDDLARVVKDDSVAWVGTLLSQVDKPMSQIRLRKGEVLDVLGVVDREQYGLSDDDPDWIQIASPAGEFRWIQAANVQSNDDVAMNQQSAIQTGTSSSFSVEGLEELTAPPQDIEIQQNTIHQRTFDDWDNEEEVAPSNPSSNGSQSGSLNIEQDWNLDIEGSGFGSNQGGSGNHGENRLPANDGAWKPARQPISKFINDRSKFQAEKAPSRTGSPNTPWGQSSEDTSTVTGQLVGTASSINAMTGTMRSSIFDDTDSTPASGMNSGANLQAPALSGNMQALEIRLSQEMLKTPKDWDLMSLAADVQRARDTAKSPTDESAASRLLEKIRKCREIQAGYQAEEGKGSVDLQTFRSNPGGIRNNSRNVANNNSGSNSNNNQSGGSTAGLAANETFLNEYDAYGYLNELVRDGGMGESTFVLQDANGRITHHIAPQPGVNLRRYLNQRVGILGNRGFHQKLNLQHVSAERVIAIDSLRR